MTYLGALAAVGFHQVLFATVPSSEVPAHMNASWEVVVVVGANLLLAIYEWLAMAWYVRSQATAGAQ